MDNSEGLIKRVHAGDTAAFREMYELNKRFVFRFIYGMVCDSALAEELTQETFVRALTSINTMRSESKVSTWLGAIAKNVVSRSFRTRKRDDLNIEIGGSHHSQLASNTPSPDDCVIGNELGDVINDALRMLSLDKRTVFVLKVLQHRSYEEIAAITGSSIPKLKVDLHRAKAEMRKILGPYLGVKR